METIVTIHILKPHPHPSNPKHWCSLPSSYHRHSLPLRLSHQLQDLASVPSNHGPGICPIDHDRPLKRIAILVDLPQGVTLARCAFDQLRGLTCAHVLEDTLQLILRRRSFGDLELKGVAGHMLVLGRVVRCLVFGCSLGCSGGGLFEDVGGADGCGDGGFVEEGYHVEGFALEEEEYVSIELLSSLPEV
jgi:hypothetical protein